MGSEARYPSVAGSNPACPIGFWEAKVAVLEKGLTEPDEIIDYIRSQERPVDKLK